MAPEESAALCADALSGAATSGKYELAQFEMSEREPASAAANSTGQQRQYTYLASETSWAHGCALFTLSTLDSTGVAHSKGGSSFYVEAIGSTLELCAVRDAGTGEYSIACAAALDDDGCMVIDASLGYENFGAYTNRVPGGSGAKAFFSRWRGGSAGGERKPLGSPLFRRQFCPPSQQAAANASASHRVRVRLRHLQPLSARCEQKV